MSIPPNIDLGDCTVKGRPSPTGPKFPQKRKLSDIFGQHIVNVREVGSSTTDWSPIIQAAIGKAFPVDSWDHPEGNKILYFPRGEYPCRSPIYFRNIRGGVIKCDGPGSAHFGFQLFLDGSDYSGPGNDDTSDGITPGFLFHNVCNTRIEGFTLEASHDNRNWSGYVGMYFYCSGGKNCDNNLIKRVTIGYFSTGIMLGGTGTDQQVRNNVLINISGGANNVDNIITARSPASVGHVILGGGGDGAGQRSISVTSGAGLGPAGPGTNCTYVSQSTIGNAAGAYAAVNGQLAVIASVCLGGCTISALNAGPYPMCFLGTRHEANVNFAAGIVSTNSPLGGLAGPVYITNHNISGTPTTLYVQADGSAVLPPGRPPSINVDVWNGGRVHDCGSSPLMEARNTGTSPDAGIAAKVDATSSYIGDATGCHSYDEYRGDIATATSLLTAGFAGAGTVFLRGLQIRQVSADTPPDTGGWWPATVQGVTFSGIFVDLTETPLTFAPAGSGRGGLPPASAAFAGTRFCISDSTVTASSATFWTAVTSGGGSHFNSLICDGSGWRIA